MFLLLSKILKEQQQQKDYIWNLVIFLRNLID